MSETSPIATLRNVFGTFSHQPPEETAIGKEKTDVPLSTDSQQVEQPNGPDTERSNISGLVTNAVFGFDGDRVSPPWNHPESDIVNFLRSSPVELIEERVLSGDNGVFWGRMRSSVGDLSSVLIRFAGIGRESAVDTWGTEFHLDEGALSLLSRESCAYEVAKGLGCEDLVLPVAVRDLNPVELISDAVRERIAKNLRIGTMQVDEAIGIPANVQMVPPAMDNFAEQWAAYGTQSAERWARSTDSLRHSMYRSYLLDFILGTPDRPVVSFGYNVSSDKMVITDMSLSFPHSGYSAEKYMQMRLKGWGRSSGGFGRFVDNTPPSCYDFSSIFTDIEDEYVEEFLMTERQMAEIMNDQIVGHIATCCIERDIPVECVASLLARIAFLVFSPGSVIRRPIEFIRNFCVPVRAGMQTSDERLANIIEYVNDIMGSVTGEAFDLTVVLQQPLIEDAEMNV